jgi:positive regulator of sigma E activity
MIISRYFISVLPAAILILAIAIANIKVHKIQLIVIVIFVIASLTDLIAVKDYYNKISKTQYREITQNIIQKNKKNAIIVSPWAGI